MRPSPAILRPCDKLCHCYFALVLLAFEDAVLPSKRHRVNAWGERALQPPSLMRERREAQERDEWLAS
jgi:hypothetical protein